MTPRGRSPRRLPRGVAPEKFPSAPPLPFRPVPPPSMSRRSAVVSLLAAAALASCDESTSPSGTPAAIRKVSGDSQVANIAIAVPFEPVIQVTTASGAPVKNARVTFTPADTSSGTVVGGTVLSFANGTAQPVGWNLGRRVGPQRLVAKVDGLRDSVIFVARARAQGGATIVARSPTTVSDTAFANVLPSVQVQDAFGNAVPGDTVTFTVDTLAFGRFNSSTIGPNVSVKVVTDSTGTAAISWRLGRRAGAHRLTATYPGPSSPRASVQFTGTATAASAAALTFNPAACFNVPAGTAVPAAQLPVLTVLDNYGNPVSGQSVTFSLDNDPGGTLSGTTQVTNASGQARVGGWTTGGSGRRVIRGAITGTPLVFATASAQAGAASAFCIEVAFLSDPGPTIRAAFDAAADRWAQIITAALPTATVTVNAPTSCAGIPVAVGTYTVPNLRILASIEPIDGPGAVLGSAGPCWYRGSSAGVVNVGELTIIGGMRFDIDDMLTLISSNRLNAVILHEMGHVLGLGTFWTPMGFLQNPVPSPCNNASLDTRYTGNFAFTQYAALRGQGTAIPVENTNGCGTANGHWLENSQPGRIGLDTELMTGFVEGTGIAMPLSAITIGSLRDMGYTVDQSRADTYLVPLSLWGPANSVAAQMQGAGLTLPLREAPMEPLRPAGPGWRTGAGRPALR